MATELLRHGVALPSTNLNLYQIASHNVSHWGLAYSREWKTRAKTKVEIPNWWPKFFDELQGPYVGVARPVLLPCAST